MGLVAVLTWLDREGESAQACPWLSPALCVSLGASGVLPVDRSVWCQAVGAVAVGSWALFTFFPCK